MTNNFKNLKVWQKAIELVTEVYKVTKTFPELEKFGIISQIQRASVSVAVNIAEGAGRNSKKEFNHFLAISNGSCYELETLLIVSKNIDYLKEDNFEKINGLSTEIQKMIYKLMSTLK